MHLVGLHHPYLLTTLTVLLTTGLWLVRPHRERLARVVLGGDPEALARKMQDILARARAEQLLNDALRERAAFQIERLTDEERATAVSLLECGERAAISIPPGECLDDEARRRMSMLQSMLEEAGHRVEPWVGGSPWWRRGLSIVVRDRNRPPRHALQIVRAFREVGV